MRGKDTDTISGEPWLPANRNRNGLLASGDQTQVAASAFAGC